jgi:chemotaxis protein methyltransferase CheR
MNAEIKKIDPAEFKLMRDYIEKHCGIHLTEEKTYLIEHRLNTVMVESGCANFSELYKKALSDASNTLRDKIIDVMTTNETLWFRDTSPYAILKEAIFPALADEMRAGKRSGIKLWSAACSTGQEPSSISMIAHELARTRPDFKPSSLHIIATDISPTVLFLAKMGRYDNIAISRGLPADMMQRYFVPNGKVFGIKDEIKKLVEFKKMNLQDSFTSIGKLDIVFCRNVLIYFSDVFKRDVLHRFVDLLKPGGFLILGASESLIQHSQEYSMAQHGKGIYYKVK